MLNRLRRFDVYPYELSELEFTIVATHTTGFAEAVDLLLGVGVDLSQIRFAYNPKATSANIAVAADDGSVRIQWQSPSAGVIPAMAAEVEDLGSIVKRSTEKNL